MTGPAALRFLQYLGVGLAAVGAAWTAWPPDADSDYFPTLRFGPTYTWPGPNVVFDEAHWNSHTTGGRYNPFARLLSADGYRVHPTRQRLVMASFRNVHVLISANPMGFQGWAARAGLDTPGGSAFDQDELDVVTEWVRNGGGLLLIAGPESAAGAAGLAARFGVRFSRQPVALGRFIPLNGLGLHQSVAGRAEYPETVAWVRSFGGQAVTASHGTPLVERPGETLAVALEHGRGRVVVVGDPEIFGARVRMENGRQVRLGINEIRGRTTVDGNRQFALNVVHWLTKLM
ncbi:MAG: hypothetical protein FJW40_08505 [Acidobacteria bacterium]|nr:hypothetical protein [Acidobacteriota bacterium]